MDWWDVLKGRGKIRIPAKRKRLKKNPNRSKATRELGYDRGTTRRDKKRDAYVERQNRMAESEDREARERAFNQPHLMTDGNFDSQALPLSMGPPSKFRRRSNFNTQQTPLRRKPVAHDRQGFRTGGGETLPLPDTQKQRDERDLREIGEEMARLMERDHSRRIKVNYPRKPSAMMYEPHLAEAEDRRFAAAKAARDRALAKVNTDLREKFQQSEALQNQQYDRAGNRIEGEQNE